MFVQYEQIAILLSWPQLILFNIVPTFVDMIIALIAFSILFEWTLTLVIFFVMFAYGKDDVFCRLSPFIFLQWLQAWLWLAGVRASGVKWMSVIPYVSRGFLRATADWSHGRLPAAFIQTVCSITKQLNILMAKNMRVVATGTLSGSTNFSSTKWLVSARVAFPLSYLDSFSRVEHAQPGPEFHHSVYLHCHWSGV